MLSLRRRRARGRMTEREVGAREMPRPMAKRHSSPQVHGPHHDRRRSSDRSCSASAPGSDCLNSSKRFVGQSRCPLDDQRLALPAIGFARNTVTIAIHVRAIAGLPGIKRCGSGRTGSAAVGIRPTAPACLCWTGLLRNYGARGRLLSIEFLCRHHVRRSIGDDPDRLALLYRRWNWGIAIPHEE